MNIAAKVLLVITGSILALPLSAHSAGPEWAGTGAYRLLVQVEAAQPGNRAADEMPAELQIDLASELHKLGVDALPDLRSLQVIEYETATGKPREYGNYAYARGPSDHPFCWYDAAIPYDFPEVADDVSRTNGKLPRTNQVRAGYFYNAMGDWKSGRLAWTHTQRGNQSSHYAIYFDLLPAGQEPPELPPRGWLGDGMPRCDERGGSTMGADHSRVDVDDFNDDGLVDLVVGESYGHVVWWPNRGTKQSPKFPYYKFVFDAAGLPLDVGAGAAPKVVDWDGDGNRDLLVGAEWNRILYFHNDGDNRERKLTYRGVLQLDGAPLQLPISPLERGSADVFKRDYYPVLETVDWDADGDLDLLAGGYITGRIYFYANTGHNDDGTPLLAFRGPLEADGKPLNVKHWCASPCIADFDGDGDLDLMTGSMPMGARGGDDINRDGRLLQYYQNVGTKLQPRLTLQDFPSTGQFSASHLASPRAADWDADGDLDLVVSAREQLFLFENQGTRAEPKFLAHATPLPSKWGTAAITAGQFRDWNGDGKLDIVQDYTVRLNSGAGNPGRWDKTVNVLPAGEYIEHPSGIGDDWFWPFLDDFDQDGKIDVLFGDWGGHVWFHRNLSTADKQHFDVAGRKLTLSHGEEIQVGPIGKNIEKDFDALQGARTVFTVADFDRDGLRDLVVGDTHGKIRFFRNAGPAAQPVFDAGVDVGDLGIRLLVDAADWNRDGWPDIVAGAANGRVRVFINGGADATSRFDAGFVPELPPIPQPRILMADLNGDGDDDLFLPSTQGACLVERSFLEHGYAQAKLVAVERKP